MSKSVHFAFEATDAKAGRIAHTKRLSYLAAVVASAGPVHQTFIAGRIITINQVMVQFYLAGINALFKEMKQARRRILTTTESDDTSVIDGEVNLNRTGFNGGSTL